MRKRTLTCAALVAAAALAAKPLTAESVKARPTPTAKKKAEPPISKAGLIITVDPETHEIRQATPNEINALEKRRALASNAASPGLAATGKLQALHHESGAEGVQLDESFMSAETATVAPDGSLRYECKDGGKNTAVNTQEKTHEKK